MDRGETLAAIGKYCAGRVGPDIAAAFVKLARPGFSLTPADVLGHVSVASPLLGAVIAPAAEAVGAEAPEGASVREVQEWKARLGWSVPDSRDPAYRLDEFDLLGMIMHRSIPRTALAEGDFAKTIPTPDYS